MISGFGRCSQRAGAGIGTGPIPDMIANLQNLYMQALLAEGPADRFQKVGLRGELPRRSLQRVGYRERHREAGRAGKPGL